MIKDLHNNDGHQEDFFSINADQGWQNMASLLDAEMPVKKKRILPWAGLLKTMMAACLLFAVLTTSDTLLMKQLAADKVIVTNHRSSGSNDISATTNTTVGKTQNDFAAQANTTTHTPLFNSNSTHTSTAYSNTHANDYGNFSPTNTGGNNPTASAGTSNGTQLALGSAAAADQIDKTQFIAGPEAAAYSQMQDNAKTESVTESKKDIADVKEADSATSNFGSRKTIKKRNSPFSLYAGTQLQQGLQSGKSFTASPYAQVQYNIGKKFTTSLGLGVYSGNGGAKAIETEENVVNDFTNNIKNYNAITSHTKLRYVDIPLQVGYKINSHLSVEAGVQVSFLVHEKKHTEYETYDFRMVSSGSIDSPPSTLGTPFAPVEKPASKPHKTDLRYLAAVRYDVGRFTAKLQYQQGFKPIMAPASTNAVTSTNTQTVNLQVLYRLWK